MRSLLDTAAGRLPHWAAGTNGMHGVTPMTRVDAAYPSLRRAII